MTAVVQLPPEITAALVLLVVGLIGAVGLAAKAWLSAIAAKAAAVEAQAQAEAAKAKAELARVQAATANERVSNVSQAQSSIRSDLTMVAAQMPPTPPADALNARLAGDTAARVASGADASGVTTLDKPKGS